MTTTPTSKLNTIYSAIGVDQTVYGNSGDDDIVLLDATDNVVVPAVHGVYTITDSAWNVGYTLPAAFNNLIVNGNDQLAWGNSQANLIETGSNADTVSGGGGDDVFVLGSGTDTVVDPLGSGDDVIYGFNTAIDKVRLDGSAFTSWSSIHSALTQSGADVVLNMGGGQTLTFRNMTVSALTSTDFNYPIPTSTLSATFDDEFTTFVSSPHGNVGWMTSWPYVGVASRAFLNSGDEAYYSDSSVGYNPFSDVNGVLSVSATTAAAAGANPDNLPYDSGVATTYNSMSQLYGYFEIRAKLPVGQGLWPAFYMQSTNGAAELDIFENLGSSPTTLYVTASDHANNTDTTQQIIIPDSSTGFHTYGVDWEPLTVTFYMDGNIIATAPTPASMDVPMYMVINLSVGGVGSFPGAPNASTVFPATMQIDYVRAYATAATEDVGGNSAIAQAISVTPATVAVTSANGVAVHPFTGVGISDINAAQTETATVALSSTANGALSDPNAATDGSKIANGVLTVSGSAAAVAAALDGLLFTPKAGQTSPSVTTTVTATIQDTAGETDTAISTITATSTVSLTVTPATEAVTSANGAGVKPFTGLVITDKNASQTETATVTLSSTANGVLSDPNAATDGSQIANGVVTMSGSAAGVAAALDGLVFTPKAGQTSPSVATTATVTILDTAGKTAVATSTITATAIVPISVTPATEAVTSANGAGVAPFSGVVITDKNASQTETATVTLSSTANGTLSDPNAATDGSQIANGVLTVSGSAAAVATALDGLVFTPQANQAVPAVTTTVTAAIVDTAGKTAVATSTITANAIVPISVTPPTAAVTTANGASVAPFAGVVITDANAAQIETATVTLSSTANGALSDPNAATDGSQIANGVLTVSGSAAAVATALDGLVFTPAAGQTAASVTTTVTATVQDTAGETDTSISTITATATASSNHGIITAAVLHYGASTDNSWGSGEGGVTVSLLNAAGVVIATTVTPSWGRYTFGQVAPGTYEIEYTAPAGQGFRAGAPENPITGETAAFTVAAGQTVMAPGAQLVSNTVVGTVLLNGVAQAGVTVTLLTVPGAVVATTTTNSAGAYTFTGMVPGGYEVGTANTLTAPFAVAAGQTVTAPPGQPILNSIGGAVTLDGAAESGVAVSLLDGNGAVLASTATVSDGTFGFTGLAAGSYEVDYAAPSGQVFQTGSAADPVAGITPVITLTAAAQALALPTEQLLSNPGTISAAVLHYGAPTDNSWGTGYAGVTVSLLNAAGTVIATAVSNGSGKFTFGQIGAGTYQLQYASGAGQGFLPGGPDSALGLTAQFTVAAGQTVTAPNGDLIDTITMNSSGLTETAPAGAYLVTGTTSNSTLTLGNGSQYVTLTGNGDSVTAGTGNHAIALTGNNNTVAVGNGGEAITLSGTGNAVFDAGFSGTSVFNATGGNNAVHVTGGTDIVTINATGGGNLFDAGPGLNFLNADGSSGNIFMLNAAGNPNASLTTITGFNPTTNDVLDLNRTLAGTNILPDLSNVGTLVTATFSGGNTELWAAPIGGGSVVPFAVLDGVQVTVAQLQAANQLSLS